MKAPQRKRLTVKWLVLAIGSFLLFLSVSAGMLGRLLVEHVLAQNWVELLIQVPGALFWSNLMPQGSMFSENPPEYFIIVVLALVALACGLRFRHHRKRFTEENRARDFHYL